jgi:hypothetical protein
MTGGNPTAEDRAAWSAKPEAHSLDLSLRCGGAEAKGPHALRGRGGQTQDGDVTISACQPPVDVLDDSNAAGRARGDFPPETHRQVGPCGRDDVAAGHDDVLIDKKPCAENNTVRIFDLNHGLSPVV